MIAIVLTRTPRMEVDFLYCCEILSTTLLLYACINTRQTNLWTHISVLLTPMQVNDHASTHWILA